MNNVTVCDKLPNKEDADLGCVYLVDSTLYVFTGEDFLIIDGSKYIILDLYYYLNTTISKLNRYKYNSDIENIINKISKLSNDIKPYINIQIEEELEKYERH